MSNHSKSTRIRTAIAVLIVVMLVLLIIISSLVLVILKENKLVNSNDTGKYNMIGKEIKLTNKQKKELYEKVKEDITKDLKSPSTAIFPQMKDWNIEVNYNNVIEVKSYVDSQNSYGAMLRADFKQRYILINKEEYICIYKKFKDEIEFDITENTEYNNFINEKVYDFQIEEFIEKCKYSTIYGSLIDYNYNKDNQNLEINVLVRDLKNEYFAYKGYLKTVIASYINQCICIPTITTNLNIQNEKKEIVATVKNINIEFLLDDWYTLWNVGIMDNTDGTDLEEKLQEKLWISSEIE